MDKKDLPDPNHRIMVLDGIRALAILLVMFHHALIFPNGSIIYEFLNRILDRMSCGVDLFFVLSGYLITGILIRSKDDPHFFRNFYARRTLRIFPLYYAYLLAYYIFVVHFKVVRFDAGKTLEATKELPWVWSYATNFLIAIKNNYITASINHFWTLALEEQFYLIWPVVIFIVSRRASLFVCAGTVILVLCLRAIWLHSFGGLHYAMHVMLPFRADSFALGGLTAVAWGDHRTRAPVVKIARAAIVGGLAAAALAWFLLPSTTMSWMSSEFRYTALAMFFAATIVLAQAQPPTALFNKLSASRTMRFFAKYSYALYVIHYPLNIACRRLLPPMKLEQFVHSALGASILEAFIVISLSSVLSYLSWHLFEKHFLLLKRFFEYRSSSAL